MYAYLVVAQYVTYRHSTEPFTVKRKLQLYNNLDCRQWVFERGYRVVSVHGTRELAEMAVKKEEEKDFNEATSLIPKLEFTFGVYTIQKRVIRFEPDIC